MPWILIVTKPRQERRALERVREQGFRCALPLLDVERIRRGRLVRVPEPLFPRYLFVEIGAHDSWVPIRSTPGVTTVVRFGLELAIVPDSVATALLEAHSHEDGDAARPLFVAGQQVVIRDGPFAGIEGVFEMTDGDARAIVLIEMLHKSVRVPVPIAALRRATAPGSDPAPPRAIAVD